MMDDDGVTLVSAHVFTKASLAEQRIDFEQPLLVVLRNENGSEHRMGVLTLVSLAEWIHEMAPETVRLHVGRNEDGDELLPHLLDAGKGALH